MDRVNPPLKTRIPVTDHPEPQHNTPKPSSKQPITTQEDHIMDDTSDTDTEDPNNDGYERDASTDTNNNDSDLSTHINQVFRGLLKVGRVLERGGRGEWWFHVQEIFRPIHKDIGGFDLERISEFYTTFAAIEPFVPPTKSTPVTHTSSQTTPPTPPSSPAQVDSSTQTLPPIAPPTPKPKPPTNSVSTNTDPPPTRTYAEAATTTTSPKKTTPSPDPPKPRAKEPKGKGKAIAGPKNTTQTRATPPPRNSPLNQPRAVVFPAAPMKYKPGLMRRWIEEDNEGARIIGIRWLLQEGRRVGKLASSLVIYLAEGIDTTCGFRMGRRVFRTSEYEWDR
ncbi:hypothetical protein L211DRAFT_237314 [Terfezia boudieri ATCC MYA-4762]|uniref:Uncharacterized protein n=1 Tax=Terfezia boudieri ATCC MYA-4762 TaxID=1051890 RepID=A0A3N4MKI1_9PEZI|nr:hypothetical protein L211DRAFT_237314 [Terfezia boudieri ATCC MYA-4762]